MDLTAAKLIDIYGKFGVPSNLPHTINSIIRIGIVAIFISPLVIPVHIVALGEEFGWRGYVLPLLIKITSKKKAVLIDGALWGICHGPLIYFGFNYGLDYLGSPFTGILMMILVCIVMGIWLCYVTMKSNSIIPAAVLHGSVNIIGELPELVAISGISTLFGPNPTGIIGMIGLLIGALILIIMI